MSSSLMHFLIGVFFQRKEFSPRGANFMPRDDSQGHYVFAPVLYPSALSVCPSVAP